MKGKTVKAFKRKQKRISSWQCSRQRFLKGAQKVLTLKEKWNIPSHIKIKNFYSPKDTRKRLKRVEEDIPNTSYCEYVKNYKSIRQ